MLIFTILPFMFLQQFIERYKKNRKQEFLDRPGTYRHRYAFVGAGQHSISNLYPLIHYLGIPLKQIFSLHAEHAVKMAARFPQCTGTGNFDDILNDDQVKGVFVSASPSQHFGLVSKLLATGKYVFVEKPPCYTLQELKELAGNAQAKHCLAGLQKRFCTINQLLQPFIAGAIDYNYRYLTGLYPEGDQAVELFIHPIDNLVLLFGNIGQAHVQPSKNDRTWFITLTHTNNVTGVLQVSTDYSWKMPVDELQVNTHSAILTASYPNTLTRIKKSPAYFNMPFEKILKSPLIKQVLFDNSNFAPTVPNNTLAVQGFLGEIEYFLKMTEKDEFSPRHHLQTLLPVYEIIEQIRQSSKH
jgi:virulence factor